MEKLAIGKFLAVAALCGVGVAAPAAVWVAQKAAPDRGKLSPTTSFGALLPRPSLPAAITPSVELDATVVVARRSSARLGSADVLSPAGDRQCHEQTSETFASGSVRVCDVDRTEVPRGSGVFGAIAKPTRLAPRDTPSPSGILAGAK